MEKKMFCFQCEQTAGLSGCAGCQGAQGVCGKSAAVSALQDQLTGALIGLARAASTAAPDAQTERLVMEGLFACVTNVNFDEKALQELIARTNAEKGRLVPDCAVCASPCGRTENYEMKEIWEAEENIRSLKSLLLFGIRGMAAYAYHAAVLGYTDPEVTGYFYRALSILGEDFPEDMLLSEVLEAGKINLRCMELLDRANTETFGHPVPTNVTMTVEKGPFIIVTGHDLLDLKLLLEQSKGKGVNVYTHGEMLPAHAYPKLKEYPHFKGHFGSAWQNQQKEFSGDGEGIPAPILYTTNCLMPPKPAYADRVFTSDAVYFPGTAHIGNEKDFSPVIKRAIELGGYRENKTFTGINGGSCLTTGFARNAVLANAGAIVEAVKAGKIRHFFLIGGCDGAKGARNYYTELVQNLPKDTVILTLGCGKFRFNDLSLSSIDGIPRLLDVGQCNDAYSAIQIALALADAFKCGVNELPLSMILSWYEQKAVAVLLTLLSLGIRSIRIGPTLPAFLSKGVLKLLSETYDLKPTTSPKEDIAAILQS